MPIKMPDFNTLNSIKSKLKADDDKKIRGLSFAKLYYANKDYQKALTYINDYLTIKNNSAEAYKLLGDVYEALNNKEKSLESYKKSFYIDKNQEGILFKICEKLETLDSVDIQTIKVWLDRLEKMYPNHKSVFILKDKLELENGNCSSRLEDTFRDLSNVKLSDLTDDKCANLSCSFLNSRSPALTPSQFKLLDRNQDRLFKKVIEIEENFNKTTDQILDLIKENQTMFGQLKGEVDKINTTLGKLQIGQKEIKETMDEFMAGNYEDVDEDEETTEEETNENDPISSFLSCSSTNQQQQNQNTSDVFSRLGPSPNKLPTSSNNSFNQQVSQPFAISNQPAQSSTPQLNQAISNLQINQPPTSGLLFQQPIQTPFSTTFNVLPPKDDQSVNKSPLAPLNQMINRIPMSSTNLNKTTVPANQNPNVPLSELYKNQNSGKWSCDVCLVTNDLNKDKCVSCETPNPSAPVKTSAAPVSKPFQVEPSSKGGFSFTQTFNQTTSQQPATDNKFVFGVPPPSFLQSNNQTNEVSKFTFDGSLIFGQQSQQQLQTSTSLSPMKQQQSSTPSTSSAIGQMPFSVPNAISGFVFGNQNATSIQLNQPVFGQNTSNISLSSPSNNVSVTSPVEDSKSTAVEEQTDAEEPQIDFTPVIPLPPKVEVVTGEEGEKVLFAHRAKLYRFTDNEWKERGLGEIKVLFDEKNNRYRLLMRREQILKVCLNAPIIPEFKFEENSNQAGNVLKWGCIDYSEEKSKPDIFSIKFKTKELVERFKAEVLKIVAILNGKPVQSTAANETTNDLIKFDDLEVVYVKEPKSNDDKEKAEKLKLPINFFNFDDVKECSGCYGCKEYMPKLRCEIEIDQQGNKDDKENENNQENSENLFSSAIAMSGSTKKIDWIKPTEKPKWMLNACAPVFGNQAATNENDPEAEIDTLTFKPIIPLPELIEVRTGEEDEEVIFSNRSKLFKFTNGEWKERGIGDFKVLKHKSTKKIRLLMRREQVHKICLNHFVDAGIKIGLRKDRETIYEWTATDYSEKVDGDPSIFNVKFKTKEIGAQFMKTLKDNVQGFEETKN